MGGHKKRAVNDKYYRLAKEQGYRARSAFKLVQLNRKYDFLTNATAVIDLGAAPGGWIQVCAKTMPKSPDRKIIGVDLLPIKPVRGCVTFVADMTSEKCRQLVRKELNGKKAQVVMCDGAPNVGAEYSKDAFVQNELTIHALKFACEHLDRGGVFVTKVFRSADYNKLMWTFEKFFRRVEATKPASSRNVSAEIFVVCRDYLAPHKIDPRMLDAKYVLDHVEAETKESENSAVSKLFQKSGAAKRNRSGYDAALGQTLHRSISAAEFIQGSEPIQMLASANEIHFKDDESKAYLANALTTTEIQEFLSDLKVLGNAEFRKALRWRTAIRDELKKLQAEEQKPTSKDEESSEGEEESSSEMDEEEAEEAGIEEAQEAMARVKEEQAKRKKREEKKKRMQKAKHQKRVELGMETEFVHELGDLNGPFSAKSLGFKSVKKLGSLEESMPTSLVPSESESEIDLSDEDEEDIDEVDVLSERERYLKRIEDEANNYYSKFEEKQSSLEPLNVQQRRMLLTEAKKSKMKKRNLELKTANDIADALEEEEARQVEGGAYLNLLQKNAKDEIDTDSEDDELTKLVKSQHNPKVEEKKKAQRFFEQSLFEGMEESEEEEVEAAQSNDDQDSKSESDNVDDESEEESDSYVPLPSDRTDKAKRKIKRAKLKKRNERKAEKRRIAAEKEALSLDPDFVSQKPGFETVKRAPEDLDMRESEADDDENENDGNVKPSWARKLIRKGMGANVVDTPDSGKFEVVKADPVKSLDESDSDEEEKYNSEDYDTDERANHLALGAMLVNKSKRRKLLDSAYNRYAFNDPDGLPDWFLTDENRHNRPQLPITKEMVDAVKSRYKDLAARPINKVAEARARKKRRLVAKVEKIKKQAAAVVDEPDIGIKSKMKQIEKLYRGAEIAKPSQVYVVSRKSSGGKMSASAKGGKVKIVDKRMKADMGRSKKAARGRSKKSGGGKRKR